MLHLLIISNPTRKLYLVLLYKFSQFFILFINGLSFHLKLV